MVVSSRVGCIVTCGKEGAVVCLALAGTPASRVSRVYSARVCTGCVMVIIVRLRFDCATAERRFIVMLVVVMHSMCSPQGTLSSHLLCKNDILSMRC